MNNFTKIVIISVLGMFIGTFTQTYMFVYCPSIVRWIGYEEHEKGFYVGVIVSAYFVAGLFTNYPFSVLSDRYGHRYVVTILLVANAVFNLFLSFSQDLYSLVSLRFLTGTCSAVIGLSRAMVIPYGDDTNHGLAMALNQSSRLVGYFFASLVGGYLVSLDEDYPGLSVSLFKTLPFFIPPFVAFLMSVVGAMVTWFLYPHDSCKAHGPNTEKDVKRYESCELKTEKDTKCREEMEDANSDSFISSTNIYSNVNGFKTDTNNSTSESQKGKKEEPKTNMSITNTPKTYSTFVSNSCNSNASTTGSNDSTVPLESTKHQRNSTASTIGKYIRNCLTSMRCSSLVGYLSNRHIMITLTSFAVISGTATSFREFYAVWASTKLDLGGLGFSTDEIGSVILIVTIPGAIIGTVLFTWMERKIGSVSMSVYMAVGMMVCTTPIATIRLVKDPYIQYAILSICQLIFQITYMMSKSALLMLVSNSVPKNESGAIHGLSRMFTAIGGTISPLVCGPIYATSIVSIVGSPVDVSMVFVFMGLNCWFAAILIIGVPTFLNSKYKE